MTSIVCPKAILTISKEDELEESREAQEYSLFIDLTDSDRISVT